MSRDSVMLSAEVELLAVKRRRRYSAAEKQRLVEQTFQPGMNVSLVARNIASPPSVLFRWRKLARLFHSTRPRPAGQFADGGRACISGRQPREPIRPRDHWIRFFLIITIAIPVPVSHCNHRSGRKDYASLPTRPSMRSQGPTTVCCSDAFKERKGS
jgi:hypothetical protein